MNRKFLGAFLIFTLVAIIALMGCSSNDNGNGDNGEHNYFPIALGNQWIFDVNKVDTAGSLSTYTAEQNIDHMTTYDSYEWFVLIEENTDTIDTLQDSTYYRKDEYLLHGVFFKGFAIPVTISPLEPTIGDFWADTSLIIFSGEVLTKETITVPAGEFECYKEKLEATVLGEDLIIYNWLGNNVGPVRIIVVYEGDSTDMKLASYTIQ